MRLACLLDALRLLRGIHFRFGGAHRGGRLLGRLLGGGQRLARARRIRLAARDGVARDLDLGKPAVALGIGLGDAALHFRLLARDRFQLVAHAAAVLGEEVDLLLERLHVGVGGIECALQLLQLVRLAVVARAQLFQRALRLAHLRGLGLERHLHLLHFVRVARLRRLRLAQAREGEQVVVQRQLRLQLLVLRGHLGLLRQVLQLCGELGLDVAHAGKVLARVFEAQLRLAAALAVLRDARGLLEEHAQLFRLRGDDARDHALLDDRVGARTQARAEEDVLHVAAAHVLAIQVVIGVAVARQHALHADLRVLRPGAADAAQRIVEDELDGGAAHGLPLARAVEDHVVHVLAAQLLGRRFAEHPAHRVDHVGFAAPVGAHHAHELPGDGDGGRIDE
jgi:hypothetical protein